MPYPAAITSSRQTGVDSGGSERNDAPYWFQDYMADLEAILDHYCADPVTLIGHSMVGTSRVCIPGFAPREFDESLRSKVLAFLESMRRLRRIAWSNGLMS